MLNRTQIVSLKFESEMFPSFVYRRLEEERHTISPQEYIDRTKIVTYLQDGLAQLQDSKDEKALQFLEKYFRNVSTGEHILFREFRFVNATPHNRRHFIDLFRRTFTSFQHTDVIGLDEFHQLLCLLCPDFPFSLVQNTARIDLNWTADPEQVVFGPFLDKLSLLFFYSEFMNVSAQSFKSLDTADSGKVPRQAYLSALLGLVGSKRNEFICPDASLLFRVLAPQAGGSVSDEIMFNEFCVHLFSYTHLALPLRMLDYPLFAPAADEHAQRTLAALQTSDGSSIEQAAAASPFAMRLASILKLGK